MAAQRLVALLVVLLLFSIALAALAPDVRDVPTGSEATTTGVRPDPAPAARSGTLIEAEVDVPVAAELPLDPIEARVGDQIALVVRVARPGPVTIEGLGRREFAEPGSPARFDLLPLFPGHFDLVVPGADEPATTIVIRARTHPPAKK